MEEGDVERVSETVVKKQDREIPADVYELEILSYLPAINLQILKAVCKNWLQLISSPYFVSLHHSRIYRSRIRVIIALSSAVAEYSNYDDQDMMQIPYPEQFSSAIHSGSKIYITGSVDGLVCMFDWMFGHGVLFNPSTGKCLQLWPLQEYPDMYVLCHWFGKSVDGEHILVTLVFSPGALYEFRIYKLTSSSAKYTHSIVYVCVPGQRCFSIHQRGTLVNGAVHWPVRRNVNEGLHLTILAYDIYENKHWEMLPPAQCYFRLGVNVDGCLLAILKNTSAFEVWIMKESWTKWANVEGFNVEYIDELSPLGFFPNGDLILDVDNKKLMRYSFNHNAATVLLEYGCCAYDAVMCADTLMSPSNSDC